MSEEEKSIAGGCALGLLSLLGFGVVVGGLYLGSVLAFDLLESEAVGTGHLVGGAVLAVVMSGVVSIMGESLIEDGIKLLIGFTFAAMASKNWGDAGLAVGLGAAVGVVTPFLARALSRLFPSRDEAA